MAGCRCSLVYEIPPGDGIAWNGEILKSHILVDGWVTH